MCIGESNGDTLAGSDCAVLREAAVESLPAHRFDQCANADGLVWVVLEPPAARPELLRFTICRIAPCVMVLVEDACGRRQIVSTSDVHDALAVARHAADQAMLAAANAHPAHASVQ